MTLLIGKYVTRRYDYLGWSHCVVDAFSFDEPVGAFLSKESADEYALYLNQQFALTERYDSDKEI